MSNVKESQQKRADAERMQKKADKQARQTKTDGQAKARFGSMMKQKGAQQKQQVGQEASRQQGEQLGEHLQGKQAEKQSQSARNARMARGGVVRHSRLMEQAKSFDQTLSRAGQETKETKETLKQERAGGMENARDATTERSSDVDQKTETKKDAETETAKAEAKAEGRVNSAISGGGKKGGGQQDSRGDGANIAAAKAGGAQAAGETGGPRTVKQIPEEILKALAEEIYVGVNAEGLAEFRVELKEGVLEGASMKVTADDRGRIHIKFDGIEGNTKNLVKASEGELFKRLKAKGLRLESLSV